MNRVASLRLSLLASLGLVSLACAATDTHGDDDGRGIPRCTSPSTNPDTGLVSCAEGYTDRVAQPCLEALLASSGVEAP